MVTGLHVRCLLIAWIWFVSNICCAAYVAPLHQRISQYDHASWREQDGVTDISGITQATDGFIWLATASGLLRFDGIHFLVENSFDGQSIEGRRIQAIHAARDGSLWIGTASGQVDHIVGHRLERYKVMGWVNAFTEDRNGVVWLVQTRVNFAQGPLCSISHTRISCVGRPDIPYANLNTIAADAAGGLWVGGPEGICHWTEHSPAQCYLHELLGPDYGRVGLRTIHIARDGAVWVGIARADHPYGVGRLIDGRWAPVGAPDGTSLDATAIAEDAAGAVWVGTMDRGVFRFQGDEVDHYGSAEGLSSNEVEGLLTDREGTVWVATDDGVDALRKLPISAFSSHQGLPGNDVSSVTSTSDGTVWIGTRPLSAIRGDTVASAPLSDLTRNKRVTAQMVDHEGRRWMGVESGLVVVDGGEDHVIVDAAGHPTGSIIRLVEDGSQSVWAQTTGPRFRLLRISEFTYEEVPLDRPLRSIAPDAGKGLWLGFLDGSAELLEGGAIVRKLSGIPDDGHLKMEADGTLLMTSSRGLMIQRGSSRRTLDIAHGLPCNGVYEAIRDKAHALWLVTNCAMVRIVASEFERWFSDPTTPIHFESLDDSDGFHAGYSGFFPMATIAADGRLWFTSDKFLQVVDPSLSLAKRPPTPVLIDEVLADRKTYELGGSIALPPRTRDLEIRYNAPSYILARKIKFKYRLEGRDPDWTDAESRREAFYTDLAPGSYRFRVIACNSDGVWNDAGASIELRIAAAFYQTTWFHALCALAGLALVWALAALRLRHLSERLRIRAEARSHERERIARELHDTLLQGAHGLVLSFQALARKLPKRDGMRIEMEAVLDQADDVIEQARDSVMALRASEPEPGDLRARLQAVLDELSSGSDVSPVLQVTGPGRALSGDVLEDVYRIGREALLNAFRHSQASKIGVRLDHDAAAFRLSVRDDGMGIDAQTLASGSRPGHWGLLGMRERSQRIGAALTLDSGIGTGTEITLEVPAARAYIDAPTSPRGRSGLRWRPCR